VYYFGLCEKEKKGMLYLGTEQGPLQSYNEQGYGIFWCFNMNSEQSEPGKREKRLVKDKDINTFFIDLDEGSRKEMWVKIITSPLTPTMVVKTFRGYHCYWFTDKATIEGFEEVQKRLIEYYGSDSKCKDIVRVLRVPGYKQWKHKEPFTISQIYLAEELVYTEKQMMEKYPMSRDYKRVSLTIPEKVFYRQARTTEEGGLHWDYFNSLNQGELLLRLSGKSYVNYEEYSLHDNNNATKQIHVNGKTTGCFVNEMGDIIADQGFSRNIFNWLRWRDYNHTDQDIYKIVREVAPEAFNN
jgi:hypothetical protein